MTFAEKLKRVTELLAVNKSEISRRAGLKPNAISSYIAKQDTVARADIAARIARALGVDLEWLSDPSKNWPPVFRHREPVGLPSRKEKSAA